MEIGVRQFSASRGNLAEAQGRALHGAEAGPRSSESSAEWVTAHEALVALALERSLLEGREGKALLCALRSAAHLHLGYGSFAEYVQRLFGYGARTTEDKLRTAVALETLPELDRALALGKTSWSAAREIARVATPATEREWLAATSGKTVREIERLVAGREPGARPSDAPSSSAQRHVLRFEVEAETLATFREAMRKLRRDSGERLDDDSALLLMARYVLGGRAENGAERESERGRGSRDGGRANYQLVLTRCDRCGRGFQEANGERIEVDAAIMDMVECDAQHVGPVGKQGIRSTLAPTPVQASAGRGAFRWSSADMTIQALPPAEAASEAFDASRFPPPASASELVQVIDPMVCPKSQRPPSVLPEPHVGQPDPSLMADEPMDESTPTRTSDASALLDPHVGERELESVRAAPMKESTPTRTSDASVLPEPHVGERDVRSIPAGPVNESTRIRELKRAVQTIPPALRRNVLRRDAERCVVTGCCHALFLDVHHIEARSEGGRNEAANLVTLCGAHHRAVHRGQLIILGAASTELRFTHADGTPYGATPSARSVELAERAFRGLRGLGFKEREARDALDRARTELREATAEELLRAALQGLAKRSMRVNRKPGPVGKAGSPTASRLATPRRAGTIMLAIMRACSPS